MESEWVAGVLGIANLFVLCNLIWYWILSFTYGRRRLILVPIFHAQYCQNTSQINPFLFRFEWWNLLTVRAIMCFGKSFESRKLKLIKYINLLRGKPLIWAGWLCGFDFIVRTLSSMSWFGTSESENNMK